MRAILWVENPVNGNEVDKVMRFILENPNSVLTMSIP